MVPDGDLSHLSWWIYFAISGAKDVLVVFGLAVTGTNPLLGVSKELHQKTIPLGSGEYCQLEWLSSCFKSSNFKL